MTTTANETPGLTAEAQRVIEAAHDALTDEMVSRLSETAGSGLALLDEINRSGIGKALPVLSQMALNGDLARLADLARVYGSAQDALSDEMVGRIAETISEGFSLLDRFSRYGAGHVVEVLEQLQASGALERMASTLPKILASMNRLERLLASLEAAEAETEAAPQPRGGVGGLWQLARDADTQRTMQFMLILARRLRETRAG